MRTLFHGGGTGTFKDLTAGHSRSAFWSMAALSIALEERYGLQSGKSEGKKGNPTCKEIIKKNHNCSLTIFFFKKNSCLLSTHTSHAIHRFSLRPMARAPLEMKDIQKTLTQHKGIIIDHL